MKTNKIEIVGNPTTKDIQTIISKILNNNDIRMMIVDGKNKKIKNISTKKQQHGSN